MTASVCEAAALNLTLLPLHFTRSLYVFTSTSVTSNEFYIIGVVLIYEPIVNCLNI